MQWPPRTLGGKVVPCDVTGYLFSLDMFTQHRYAVEQFAFATIVSFLWIQTFASLEGYETVQVLLVSIRDMLQALGGFSLILTVCARRVR